MAIGALAGSMLALATFADAGAPDAGAEGPLDAGTDAGESPIPPPPGWLAWKPPLAPEDYRRKNEGWYLTGLPLLNYDPNTGVGFGARGYWYYDGARDDPLFAYAPYQHRVFLQLFATTGGVQYHWLDWDAPFIFGTPFRLRAELGYARGTATNYFGQGARTLGPLSFPGSAETFSSAAAYDRAVMQLQPDGTAYTLYDKFDGERPFLEVRAERHFLSGRLRVLGGFAFAHVTLRELTGKTVDAESGGEKVKAPLASTRLKDECAQGLVIGCGGGWDNQVALGVSFDTRDLEPDPNSGVFIDASLHWGTRVLGSGFDFLRFFLDARAFVSPIPRWADLVIAGRVMWLIQSAGAPFFASPVLPFSETSTSGLGGYRTLRGFRAMRFVGPMMTLLNLELRWTFVRFELLAQKWGLIACPFLDLGRVYDRVSDFTLRGWKRTQGAGLRISWNQATVLMADVGFSEEDWGLYLNFGHIF